MPASEDHVAFCVRRLLRERLPQGSGDPAAVGASLPGEARIRELGLDSVGVMDLVMAVEDEFDMIFPLDRLGEVETVDDLTAVIRGLMAERTAP